MNDIVEVMIWWEHWGRDAVARWRKAQPQPVTCEPVLTPEREQEHLKYLAEHPMLPF